ncbi:MAG: glutamate 5-kinase [Deltaproteobacteria bacterium]|nr:glutamate 5-kinase [Deltaproteobacteria bacterium]
MNPMTQYRKIVTQARRVVLKVGSGVLTRDNGLDLKLIRSLADDNSHCRQENREIILVSSGAIASGLKKVGLTEKPRTVQQKQACAAIGQASLIMAYENSLNRYGHKVAQILLTFDDLSNRRRYLNARNTLTTLLEWDIIPIIKENDTVAVDEIKFGDNDTLSSLITTLVEADLLVNLTDIDGLFDRDPRQDPKARFIPLVKSIGPKIEALAGSIPGAMGMGGMYAKVIAAKRVAKTGVPTVIANGKKKGILKRILAGEAEGTLFLPRPKRLERRKHWIAYTARVRGRIVVDDGAKKALLKHGKSLLPSGITRIKDQFSLGDSVEVVDRRGRPVAVGLTNYSSGELNQILGCQTDEIEGRLGYKHSDEIIHRNNMVVGKDLLA